MLRTRLFLGLLALAPILPGQSVAPENVPALQVLAEKGDPAAQNKLGNLYAAGQGVNQDYGEALKWYQRAGDKGYAPAEFNLGVAYDLGRGVAADPQQAFRYYLLAAQQGFGPAQLSVGSMYAAGRGIAQDEAEAADWYLQAANLGVAEAQFNLGLAFENGKGVKKDEAQAAHWYRAAADQGNARAQYALGVLNEDGRGMPQDDTAAVNFYRAAARQGFAPAQNNLGLMYFSGRGGLPADSIQAYAWMALAVENGAPANARDAIGKSLTPDQLHEATDQLARLRNELLPVVHVDAAKQDATGKNPSAAVPAIPVVRTEAPSPAATNGEAEIARLAEANATLKKDLAAAEAEKQKLQSAKENADALRARIVQLEFENKQLKGAATESTALADARAKIADLQNQLRETRGSADRVHLPPPDDTARKKAETELASANQSITTLRTQVTELTANMAKLQSDLESARRSADAATVAAGANAEVQRKNQELASENQKIAAERDELRRQLDEAGRQNHTRDGSIADLTVDRENLRKERDDLKQQLATLSGQLDAARKSKLEDSEQVSGRLKILQGQLDAAGSQLAALQQENATLKQQVAGAGKSDTEALAQARDRLAGLQAKLDEAQKAAAASTSAAQDRDAGFAQLQQENATLKSRVAQMQATLDAQAAGRGGNATATPAIPKAPVHVVAAGDTLSRISQKYYGTPDRWQEIYNANKDTLGPNGVLRVGMQLKIP